jgi:glycosyltransferase involved in cell wall biosynthesis
MGPKMGVTINGRFLTQETTGVQRFAREIVVGLDKFFNALPHPPSVDLVFPRGTTARLPLKVIRQQEVGRLHGQIWEQLDLPLHAGKRLLVCLGNTGAVLHRNQIVTIHDASVYAAPNSYRWSFRTWYRTVLPLLAQRAVKVVTVSEFSKSEIVRFIGIDDRKCAVVPNGVDHLLSVEADHSVAEAECLTPGSFVLVVASHAPHKNIDSVTAAAPTLHRQGMRVVLAGSRPTGVFTQATVDRGHVTVLGRISDGAMKALYQRALCLVFPSSYEGFGIPPLEAMSLGCPVVAAKAAAIPEVCGDSALFFEPLDREGMIRLALTLRSDPQLRSRLIERGRVHAAGFQWQRSADQIGALIMSSLERRPR